MNLLALFMLNPSDAREISEAVEDWFSKEARDLPWRQNISPYRVWVSEIMLQQTQVAKVIDYFNRFIERFDSVEKLAKASEDEVLSFWSGLGYYSRCRNLHRAAQKIMTEYDGVFPANREAILALPGIGSYTAGAIQSFAFGQIAPVVDGNIARVLSRLNLEFSPIDSSKGKKIFEALSLELAESSLHPGKFQEGLMEIGATLCKPRNPLCTLCPIASHCAAKRENKWHLLPVKGEKPELKELHAVFAVIGDDKNIWLERNENSRLFNKLYAPPHVFIKENEKSEDALIKLSEQFGFKMPITPLSKTVVIKKLTHRILHLHGYVIRRSRDEMPSANWVKRSELSKIGLSSAVKSLLEKAQLCAFSLLMLIGCTQSQEYVRQKSAVQEISEESGRPSDTQGEKVSERGWRDTVVKIAKGTIGKRKLEHKGKTFRRDCSGTVRAIFELAGISLKSGTPTKRQTDTKTLFEYVQANGRITFDNPETGDLVFFDYTYDVNRDGKMNDRFTHVGVVTDVSSDGQILYVHYSHGRIIESTMKDNLRRKKHKAKGSSGSELFAGYGKPEFGRI